MSKPLIEIKNLSTYFPIHGGLFNKKVGEVKAVNQVNLSIERGQTLGLVGESGCGKSTLGRSILRLINPTQGEVLYEGEDILKFSHQKMLGMRKKMQIIFQDPFASLNPRMPVGSILREPLLIHFSKQSRQEHFKQIFDLLNYVGLSRDSIYKYPHEFSGGQRQRICIARALAVKPEFIVCDEPVSALDVSVQAQVVNLLMDLQKEFGLTYLFIAHDLKVVEFISDRVAVMYLGNVVELADGKSMYQTPKHPYTKALLSAIPKPIPRQLQVQSEHKRIILEGDLPSPMNPPDGCHFHPRCFKKKPECLQAYPAITQGNLAHEYRCFFPE